MLSLEQRISPRECSSFLRDVWTMSQRVGTDRFEGLNRHLLRRSLRSAFDSSGVDPAEFVPRIGAAVDVVAGARDPVYRQALIQFLVTAPAGDLVELARGPSPAPEPPNAPSAQRIISRALILLSFATTRSERFLADIPGGKGNLLAWWPTWASNRGVWDLTNDPADFDLLIWADVETAIHDLQAWEGAPGSVAQSRLSWRALTAGALSVLGATERIALATLI
jgi:hypothetical protein